jgi:Glycosyltransferase family 87
MTRVFPKRLLVALLMGALAANVIVRGVVPASSRVTADFPSYFTAARIVAARGSVERLYDIPWFQEQMRLYRIGKPSAGKFTPLPPPTALLLVPLTSLEPLDALRVLTAISALCLIGSIILLARILMWPVVDAAVLVLLSGSAILSCLRFGQPYILVSACCILGYYAYIAGRPWLSGVCFGIFTPLKFFPAIFLLCFAVRKRWPVVIGGTLTIVAVLLVSIVVLGWRVHEEYLTSVLGSHLVAKISMQDPFSVSFQSFDTLYRRLFVFDATANPRPLIDSQALAGTATVLTKAAISLVTLATLGRLTRASGSLPIAPAIGLLAIVTLLLAPATATYHFVLLWLPVSLLVDSFLRIRAATCAYLLLGCYALIGFFPYGLTAPFEGRGVLSMLAYPRLFLLLTMFAVCVRCLWNQAAAEGSRTGASATPATIPATSARP